MLKLQFFICLLILTVSASIFAQASLPITSLQALVVTTGDWSAVQGKAQRFERKSAQSEWKPVGQPFAVVVGKNGMAWGAGLIKPPLGNDAPPIKAEGDGKSPAGIFALTSAFGSSAKPSFVKLPYTRLTSTVQCVDDTNSLSYNLLIDSANIENKDWKSSEKMLAVGAPYDLGVFVAHNADRKKGDGSCIFLHIWTNSKTGTAGCTAMKRSDIEETLAWLDTNKNPILIQMPKADYQKYQTLWKIPKIERLLH